MDERVRPTLPRATRTPLAALASAAALILGACGGTPAASPATSAPAATEAASVAPSAAPSEAPSVSVEPSAEPSESAAANLLEVKAQDFEFGLSATAPAGPTHVTLSNEGKELHQAQIARLNEGVTLEQVTTAVQNPDPSGALQMVTLVGGPTGVEPGKSGSVDLALEAGTHVFLCFIAGADNVPHIAKGMIASLEVTEPATAGSLPAGDAALTLQDFTFVGLDSLTTGKHTVAVTNNGPQPHEAGIVRLAEGMTVPEVTEMLKAPQQSGPPPWTDVGGIAGIAPGSTATMDVDLPAGDYAFVCFIPDPATGNPHLLLGMIGALTVE